MRTALLETRTTKSKINFVAAKLILSKMSHESEHSESEILLSRRIVPCRTTSSVANSLRKRRKKFNTPTSVANEEAHNFLRSQQANRRSRKQLLRINCPIISFWNKQAVLWRNFFPWKASKNSLCGQKQEN